MCSICGFFHHRHLDESRLSEMNNTIKYRGPDDSGLFIEDLYTEGNCPLQIGLAHNRLSIMDLSTLGHQPMPTNDLSVIISYNGEIYNFQSIKKELIEKGYSFRSNCDTEVILNAYLEWGIDCVNKFNGMFAFSIWDKRKQTLFLVRDRMGVKPLYYYLFKGDIAFSSELKPILKYPFFQKEINLNALSEFLILQYITGPDTIFNNVYKLEPGHILEVKSQANGFQINDEQYWDISKKYKEKKANKFLRSYDEEKEYLKSLLLDAVRLRMISDVPIGSFLSGGYDSTLITSLMVELSENKVNTFTIGFRENLYDESSYANEIAQTLGTNHYCEILSKEDSKRYIELIPKYYDEPMSDESSIATMMLSSITKKNVTVALSGDAGDELFCGYQMYHDYERYNKMATCSGILNGLDGIVPIKKSISKLNARKISKLFYMDSVEHIINAQYYTYWDRYKDLLKENYLNRKYVDTSELSDNPVMNWMLTHIVTYLPDDILTKVDRASMSVALETRAPFLDYRIVEESLAMPFEYKYKDGIMKRILKDLTYQYVPKNLLNRPKKGFTVPIREWLKEDFDGFTHGLLDDEYLKKQDIFNVNIIGRMKRQFMKKFDPAYGNELWNILVFQLWWDEYCG